MAASSDSSPGSALASSSSGVRTRLTVGELARASGLSERVLRHWEDVGVISAERTGSGHRRYAPAQVTHLHRALALRRTGLSLMRIASLLDEDDPDPVHTLRAHLADLDADLQRRGRLRDRLAEALKTMEEPGGDGELAPQELMRVIETMTMFERYVHGYRRQEHRRLRDQADTLDGLLHRDTGYASGESVLEVGCGVGAQTVALASRSPGTRITSIDLSEDSLEQARARVDAEGFDSVNFARADVFDLPYPTGRLAAHGFDHVFVCFLLEHLDRPAEALTRLRRMLRPGGTITIIEGDHGSTYFHPDSGAARDAIDCQIRLQHLAGGDALIGRRLFPLLAEAEFDDVHVSPRQVYVDDSHPTLVDGFIRKTFTAMIEGVREPALSAGLIAPERFDAGVRDLLRTTEPDGVFCYTFFKATAKVCSQ